MPEGPEIRRAADCLASRIERSTLGSRRIYWCPSCQASP